MAFRIATADTFVPRRRIGWSERAALVAGAFACVVGAAAWLTEARSSAWQTSADILSFEDRFVPPTAFESRRAHAALQPLDRSALSVLEAKLRDAKGQLAQQLVSSGWRSTVEADSPPAATTDIPLPRSRPAEADIQLAVDSTAPAPRTDDRSMLQKLSDLLPGKLTLASLTPNSGLFKRGPDLAALGYDGQTAVYDISARCGVPAERHEP